VLLALSSILRIARSWEYACGSFSLSDITMPREGVRKEQRSFTDAEVGKILSAAQEPFGTILAVTAILGLRIGEVLALRVSDVDLTQGLSEFGRALTLQHGQFKRSSLRPIAQTFRCRLN
jgi:integrase